MTHTLPAAPPSAPDVAFAALPLFGRLRDALRAAARFRDRCRDAGRRRWGVPDLFFFEPDLQLEWNAVRPARDRVPTAVIAAVSRRDPAAVRACVELAELADDALTVLAAGADARHAARAVPGLTEAAAALAADHPKARQIAEVLAVPDDEVVRVIHPAARAGYRVLVRGVADVYQFHVLLADAVTGDPAQGLLPGARPDPRVIAAYRDAPAVGPGPVVFARFQFFRPQALRPDGTLPPGFAGSDDWLWGPELLSAVPRVYGERTVLLAEPTVRASWDAVRRLSWLTGELDVIEVMTAAEVTGWIEARTGQRLPAERAPVLRAA
ncbi:MAG TPA: hypothetical protein VFG68_03755 [Fimbriiglobus sp.]|nr:hypothetical protein [Fimbriiglobus sp.]